MLKTVMTAIVLGAFGFLVGAFVPGVVAYSISFLRSHVRRLKTFLRLAGRLSAAILILFLIGVLILEATRMLGASGELSSSFEMASYLIGTQIGFWGSIVALIIRYRMRKAD